MSPIQLLSRTLLHRGFVRILLLLVLALWVGTAVAQIQSTPALPTVVSLQSATGSVTLGATTLLTVTISAAQLGPTDVVLRASGLVTVAPKVIIPAGQTSAPITVGTIGLGTVLVKASLNGTVAVAAVQVTVPSSSPTVSAMTPSQ